MPTVFISYCREDEATLKDFVSALEDKYGEKNIWYDQKIPNDSDWYQQITDWIGSCKCFLCILSPRFVNSQACNHEYAVATYLKKPTVHLLVNHFEDPFRFSQRQYINAVSLDTSQRIKVIFDEIDKIEKQLRRRRLRLIGCAIVAFAVIAGIIWMGSRYSALNGERLSLIDTLTLARLPGVNDNYDKIYDSYILCSQGYYEDARQKVQRVLNQDPGNALALLARASCSLTEANDISRSPSLNPDATWEDASKKYQTALIDYEAILSMPNPTDEYAHLTAYYGRAEINNLYFRRESDNSYARKALADYLIIIRIYPDPDPDIDTSVREFVARSYYRIGEFYEEMRSKEDVCLMYSSAYEITDSSELKKHIENKLANYPDCSIATEPISEG